MTEISFPKRQEEKAEPPVVRPTRLQEIIRQWITLIPLATAVMGSASLRMLPEDQYTVVLPPLFFAGALLVTASMLHQRRLLTLNLELTDSLQSANQHLDTLHRLAIELSKSLNATQVAQTVLQHTLQLMDANAGALWLRTELVPDEPTETVEQELQPVAATGDQNPDYQYDLELQWRLFATHGFSTPEQRAVLKDWEAKLGRGDYSHAANEGKQLSELSSNSLPPKSTVKTAESPEHSDNFIWVPITWKGKVSGAIFIMNWQHALPRDNTVLLDDIALVAGPALQNALLYQETAERAEIDGLTRLYNHRAIQERLTQELARVHRARLTNPYVTFAVAIMDVTDFKLFNDTYGHAVGDMVLRNVSDCLRRTFRISDIVGRFGGDEFIALLPDTPCRGAEVLCARAIGAVAAQPFIAPDGSPITIRLTCGVGVYPEDGKEVTDLLQVADERLYGAKRKGELIIDDSCRRPIPNTLTLSPEWSSIGLLDTLITTIDAKDHYTRGHCEKAWKFALLIAHELKLSREMLEAVHICSLVHDVGKIVVPDAILRKPGRLTEEEIQIMQQHTIFGGMIVKDVPHLETVLGGVRHHHEHFDGNGYPDKLRQEDIPLLGRLMAVADSYAAIISHHSYRKALTEKQALEEIESGRGRQYDPMIVDAFVRMMQRATGDTTTALQQVLLVNDIVHFCRAEMPSASVGKTHQDPELQETNKTNDSRPESI